MCLDVLLQVLWALEALAALDALVWLQRNVNTDVGSNVVALNGGGAAVSPSTGQVKVVGRLASNMALADVLVECLGGLAALLALIPLAGEVVIAENWLAGSLGRCICSCWCWLWSWGSWAVHANAHSWSLRSLVLGGHLGTVWQNPYCRYKG